MPIIKCDNCGKEVFKTQNSISRSKSGKLFCSRKCCEKALSKNGIFAELKKNY